MNSIWYVLYNLTLSLWTGGISLFTFIVTPLLFMSFERDMAGKIVGNLFPGYFTYNLILSVLALILLVPQHSLLTKINFKLSLILVVCALIINIFIAYILHPHMKQIKQDIPSIEAPADNTPHRKRFRKLHALSASLNLLLLADGITLLVLSSVSRKP